MNITLYNENVIDALRKIPDESIDCIVSSPPYYSLRSYKGAETIWRGNPECEHDWIVDLCSKCGAWKGQLGLEPTYQMYINHLMFVMKELKRVLKKTGTLFWNMGDSYASSGGANRHFGYPDPKWDKARNGSFEEPTAFDQGIEPKSLMMIPERFAIAMIDNGWILRNTLCWHKKNAMPSSVKDRLSNKWEYVFFFTKSQKYYFDLDSIRKPLAESSVKRISQKNIPNQFKSGKSVDFAETNPVNNIPKILNNMHNSFNIRVRDAKKGILDKKWGDKYTASDEEIANYDEKNYMPKISNNMYQKYQQEGAYKGSHSGYFNEDGSPRVNLSGANPGDVLNIPTMPHKFAHFAVMPETLVNPLIKAGCPSDGVVLDPFAGSGTVGVVAMRQNKNSILIEISPEYCDIIKERLHWGAGLGVEYADSLDDLCMVKFPQEVMK